MDWIGKKVGAWLPLFILLVVVFTVQAFPAAGEVYAVYVYPFIATALSFFSGLFPFSVGDLFIVLSISGLFLYLGYAVYKRLPVWGILYRVFIFLGYIYVWFYLAWGLNYFRKDFYTRTGIPYVAYSSESFRSFLSGYIDNLNDSYVPINDLDTLLVEREVKAGYTEIASAFGIISPDTVFKSKPMLSDALMSKVGVLGYMGPFFSEFCLNKELLPFQYPTSYAHELAHRLSISEEAEANLYAYLVCTRSADPEIRFCGYFSLFSYVMNNAMVLLPEDEFQQLLASVRPEVLAMYKEKRIFWEEKYSPFVGNIQHTLYTIFLKGNNIESGTENYSEVIGLLISYERTFPIIKAEPLLLVQSY